MKGEDVGFEKLTSTRKMINYDDELQNLSQFDAIITKEMALIDGLQLSQNSLKDYINTYVDEISITFANDEVFKNMLLASLETALLQIGINTTDLTNLYNILDIILSKKTSLKENVEQYNKLFAKVEKNINIVREILQKTINSFEQLSAISNKTISPSKENKAKLDEAKQAIMGTEKKSKSRKNISRNIKEITDKASSDLLCFFPKSDNDILAISTVQDTYKVMFDEEVATVCIEDDNFNFTLKTIGVQISNSENVLLISRETPGYFIITNMPIEVPSYINVSRIDRNKNFIEIGINNTSLSIAVTKNEITFSDELEAPVTVKSRAKHAKSVSVSPSEDDPLPKRLADVQAQTVAAQVQAQVQAQPILNQVQPYLQAPIQPPVIQPQVQAPFVQQTVQPPVVQVETPAPATEPEPAPAPTKKKKVEVVEEDNEDEVVEKPANKKTKKPVKVVEEDDEDEDEDDIDLMKDNDTLIISEEDNQVILPYKLSEVERQYKKNKKKYSSVKDLIQNEYIIPTENFKNPIKSRFREAYQLIKKKEHGHLKEAIELGFELMFQSNLNPAVIAACKNLKELDIYLDCLDDNELDKFSCFNIVYNIPPSRSKGKKK